MNNACFIKITSDAYRGINGANRSVKDAFGS
jgi:hypothetical protein